MGGRRYGCGRIATPLGRRRALNLAVYDEDENSHSVTFNLPNEVNFGRRLRSSRREHRAGGSGLSLSVGSLAIVATIRIWGDVGSRGVATADSGGGVLAAVCQQLR